MKKIILPFLSCIAILGSSYAQERYVDEVFTDFTVDNNIQYGVNFTVVAASLGIPSIPTGTDFDQDGTPDIYTSQMEIWKRKDL